MRAFHLALAAFTFACAAPASAAVTILASNVNLADGPFTFGVTPQDRFTLSFNSREQFDPSPVLVSTAGTAAVTTVFGEPSVFFTRANVVIGPSTFPGFASVPIPTRASFSATESDLGLRYTVDANNFFGYARFAGANLITVAFESSANTAIVAGSMPVMSAIPEPATWAFMLVGFGAVGYSMRRRGQGQAAFDPKPVAASA